MAQELIIITIARHIFSAYRNTFLSIYTTNIFIITVSGLLFISTESTPCVSGTITMNGHLWRPLVYDATPGKLLHPSVPPFLYLEVTQDSHKINSVCGHVYRYIWMFIPNTCLTKVLVKLPQVKHSFLPHLVIKLEMYFSRGKSKIPCSMNVYKMMAENTLNLLKV